MQTHPMVTTAAVVISLTMFAWKDLAIAQQPSTGPGAGGTTVSHEHEAISILVGSCLECHGGDKKGGLDLRTSAAALRGGDSGPALAPSRAGDSLLFQRVRSHEMPPNQPLSEKQIASLQRWIDHGAVFPQEPLDAFSITTDRRAGYDWWALQPLAEVQVPDPAGLPARWQRSPIDRFVFAKLQAEGLSPSPPADPRVLIRRATYDLTGLPPAPEEVDRFVEACAQETNTPTAVGPRAYEALIDQLLASSHYGQQWGRHWLDVVRFGESNGFERNVIITNAWPFRDYVIRSFNEDKPFAQLVVEHLAGDVVGHDDPEIAVGTTFLVCGPYDNVGNQDPVKAAQIRADTIDEMIRATGTAFLGLTIGCSRCHDHKFDPISQQDYYSLYATFSGVRHGEREIPFEPDETLVRKIQSVQQSLANIDRQLAEYEPIASRFESIVLDDEAHETEEAGERGITILQPQRGHGENPAGSGRGFRDDLGDPNRTPNLSRGRYRWWEVEPGQEVFSWNPASEGRFRIWLSWGCGWPGHATDAEYLLDRDGDLATQEDQQLIATMDQRHFAGGGPSELPNQALWSGFFDAGVHELGPRSRLVLRGGDHRGSVTADVVVFQRSPTRTETAPLGPSRQPYLRRSVNPKRNVERIPPTRARFVRFTVTATHAGEPCLDELEVYSADRQEAASRNVATDPGVKRSSSGDYAGDPQHQLLHLNDGNYGNAHSWISNDPHGGWVQLELTEEAVIDRIVWGRDREGRYQDRLATEYTIAVSTNGREWRTVASSSDRLPYRDGGDSGHQPLFVSLDAQQSKQVADHLDSLRLRTEELDTLQRQAAAPKWWMGQFEQDDGPYHVFVGGNPERKGKLIQPGSTKFVKVASAAYQLDRTSPEHERRLALAKWIVAEDQPLTPRVLANRIWHYHFGTGLVSTPSDFGFMGGRPSHPELLDWLACELKRQNWRMKPIHKLIMLSQSYQQASRFREDAARVDADSRLLWRFPPRRLSAEEIRDTMLTITGKLDTGHGGPGFRLFRYVEDNVATYYPRDEHGPETYRRAVYHHNARAMHVDLMTEFDAPDCAFATPRRSATTTPLQALSLLNHKFTIDMADFLAARIQQAAGSVPAEQIELAFRLAFSRRPDETEAAAAEQLVETHGLRALCRALLNANELIYLN